MVKVRRIRLVHKLTRNLRLNRKKTPYLYEVIEVPRYIVQLRILFFWVTIKEFIDFDTPDFARSEAEEFIDKYNESI